MSLSFEIELELDNVVRKDFKRRTEVQHERTTQDIVEGYVYAEFAKWLVAEFENRKRKIQIVCANCGTDWTTDHRCE